MKKIITIIHNKKIKKKNTRQSLIIRIIHMYLFQVYFVAAFLTFKFIFSFFFREFTFWLPLLLVKKKQLLPYDYAMNKHSST